MMILNIFPLFFNARGTVATYQRERYVLKCSAMCQGVQQRPVRLDKTECLSSPHSKKALGSGPPAS